MSETAVDKTSRRIAQIFADHCFDWQATVYLSNESDEENHRQLMKCKRLIQKDNPAVYILSFISYSTNKDTGEQEPYICFYSWLNLIGTSVRNAQEEQGFKVVGEHPTRPNRKFISRHLTIDQTEGLIRRIRKEKVFDLCMFFGDKKLRRYSFLNSSVEPSPKTLKITQESYQQKKDEWYARRRPNKKSNQT